MAIGNEDTTSRVTRNTLALFRFLLDFVALRTKTVRDVSQYEDIVWLADIPRRRGCHCAVWGTGEDTETHSWLSVKQPRLIPPPQPSGELVRWMRPSEISDSSLEMPELLDELATDRDEQVPSPPSSILDHPEIKREWEEYVQNSWWPWAERDRVEQAVQRVYSKLFAMYQRQQRLGEQYEIVLGVGLLCWEPDGHAPLRRHAVVANASLELDGRRGVIEASAASDGPDLRFELDMVEPSLRPDSTEQQGLNESLEALGEELWASDGLSAVLTELVRLLSPQGQYQSTMVAERGVSPAPRVDFAPALILRRRTERSLTTAFADIVGQLESGVQVPPALAKFMSSTDPGTACESSLVVDSTQESETYFPLEANEEQLRIVERLRDNPGVLVQGPPGTGKSHTIVNLMCHLLAAGKRVLVSSQGARALRVLRRYIDERVPEIAPLAVVLLGADRESLQAMEDSVAGITSKHSFWDPEESDARLSQFESQLDVARRQGAEAYKRLVAIRETEVFEHSSACGGYHGTLRAIASRLGNEEAELGWIRFPVAAEAAPPVTDEEFRELLHLLRESELSDWIQTGTRLPQPEELPDPASLEGLVTIETGAIEACERDGMHDDGSKSQLLAEADPSVLKRLESDVQELLDIADRIDRHIQPWTGRLVREVLGDKDRVWRELLEATQEHLREVADRTRWADELQVGGLGARDRHVVRAQAERLRDHLRGGGSWGFGPFRHKTAKECLYFREEVTVQGQACDTPELIRDLLEWLAIFEHIRLVSELWSDVCECSLKGFSAQVGEYEDLCEPLEDAMTLLTVKARVQGGIDGIGGVAEPTWHDVEDLKRLLRSISSARHMQARTSATASVEVLLRRIAKLAESEHSDPLLGEMAGFAEGRDTGAYRLAHAEIERRRILVAASKRRAQLLDALGDSSSDLAEELQRSAADSVWDDRSAAFVRAWNWARCSEWVRDMAKPGVEREAYREVESARTRSKELLARIAAESAWQRCFHAMSEEARRSLVAWSKAVRRIGKGTGKYAAQHRREARGHLQACQRAIPAWIMPLYRVADTIAVKPNQFDVVILDEASQSGPEALLCAYLAKSMVVVGDDKQISPTYAGVNHRDVTVLRTRHLGDLPQSDSYGVHQSIFDLAEIAFSGRIRLREHFRCMPEIIQFSNQLCYSGEPLIPLRQYGKGRLEPVVSTRYITGGYMKGRSSQAVNPPEAEAIVEHIVNMCGDADGYAGKSIGVISLLGSGQARLIESMLIEHVGPDILEERQIVCGDAYAFQGDERDVMLLSMVSAPADDRRIGVLANEAAKRRFNVAASRARDQMILFHSVRLGDLSKDCVRHALLQYCLDPHVPREEVSGLSLTQLSTAAAMADRTRENPPAPFESWFELDVYLALEPIAREKRWVLIPQLEVGRYRIDLVVQGAARRVAVECDGDAWHGPERYLDDMARQLELERCGWVFHRIRASAFYLDREGATTAASEVLEAHCGDVLQANAMERWHDEDERASSPSCGRAARADREHTQAGGGPAGMQEPRDTRSVSTARGGEQGAECGRSAVKREEDDGPMGTQTEDEVADRVRFTDPEVAPPKDLVPGLVELVRGHGPVVVDRLYRLYVKAAGRRRVGRRLRRNLDKGLAKAIRSGAVAVRRETSEQGFKGQVVRIPGTPTIRIRPLGDRRLDEVPDSEIAATMIKHERVGGNLSEEELFRATLVSYSQLKLTTAVKQRLERIRQRQQSLVADDTS